MLRTAWDVPIVSPGAWGGIGLSGAVAPFDPAGVSNVRIIADVGAVTITWDSAAPAGTTYQVYQDGRLIAETTAHRLTTPLGVPAGTRAYFAVGTVGDFNVGVDYGGTIAHPANRATLTWDGGRYLSESLVGFHIYMGAMPGAAPGPTPVGTVLAAPGGTWADGWGRGRWGRGGWGHGAVSYTWTSRPLTSGTWHFAIGAYDSAGDESTLATATQVITVPPPAPPQRALDGARLWIVSYDAATGHYTLGWSYPT